MESQPNEMYVNEWLTWESAFDCECNPPQPVGSIFPDWYRNLSGDLRNYKPEGFGGNHTARQCLGLRGLTGIGYTIPTFIEIARPDTRLSRSFVTAQQLYGTKWAEKDSNGNDIWETRILFFPWRAKMAKGWKMLITSYLLDWNDNYHCFSGSVEPNYNISPANGIGSGYEWPVELDIDNYNYYNIEMVVAFRKGYTIPSGTLLFTAIPLWDPTHVPRKYEYKQNI